MFFPSTSSVQTNNKSAQGVSNNKETTFKTSNPQIFPSLNPLGALYKQRKVVHPNPLLHEHSDAPEPVKKVKLNNGVEERAAILNSGYTHQQTENVDKDGFRLPKLPKRLEAQSKKQGFNNVGRQETQKGVKLSKENRSNKKSQVKLAQNEEFPQQNIALAFQSLDPLAWNAIYDRLRLEYIAFQLKQNPEYFYYMCQNQISDNGFAQGKFNPAVSC